MKNYRETHKDDHIVFIDLKAYVRERERDRERGVYYPGMITCL